MHIFQLNPGIKLFLNGPCVKPSKLVLFSSSGPSHSAMQTKHLPLRARRLKQNCWVLQCEVSLQGLNDISLKADMAARTWDFPRTSSRFQLSSSLWKQPQFTLFYSLSPIWMQTMHENKTPLLLRTNTNIQRVNLFKSTPCPCVMAFFLHFLVDVLCMHVYLSVFRCECGLRVYFVLQWLGWPVILV